MKNLRLIIPLLILLACELVSPLRKFSSTINRIDQNLKTILELCAEVHTDDLVSPRSFVDEKFIMVPSEDWTSGFFAGELWIMYDLTSDSYWKEKALEYTLPLEREKWNSDSHDIGIKMYCSFGKAWKHTNDFQYRDILLRSAKSLATRFKPNVGSICSWNNNLGKWNFPVDIDVMMNLELLFWAANETGNALFREIAIKHAEMTMENHFRNDYSCYQVVDYDPERGEVQSRSTYLEDSDDSAWSRGQAWGLYGFTMVYRETGDKKFLKHAENIAEYILNHPKLPDDLIPFCDFEKPDIPSQQRDASAAAIIASALFELSTYSKNGEQYFNTADKIVETLLSEEYFANHKRNGGFLLQHVADSGADGSIVDGSSVYADYFLIEAISRKLAMDTM